MVNLPNLKWPVPAQRHRVASVTTLPSQGFDYSFGWSHISGSLSTAVAGTAHLQPSRGVWSHMGHLSAARAIRLGDPQLQQIIMSGLSMLLHSDVMSSASCWCVDPVAENVEALLLVRVAPHIGQASGAIGIIFVAPHSPQIHTSWG